MNLRLSKLQKQLCNQLQTALPVCARPYAALAERLGDNEQNLITETRKLKQAGVIRRIGAVINHRALGWTSTLVAANVTDQDLKQVAEAVNALQGVSHNYLRNHHYNLWFTLQAEGEQEIELILTRLSGRFGIDFMNLPVERVFKLDVRFNAEGGEPLTQETAETPRNEKVELSEKEKAILSKLQDDLEVTARPFDFLSPEDLPEQQVFRIIGDLIDKGVIRRIAAVMDHRKLGFGANVLFCCKLADDRVLEAGQRLSLFGSVSHCYQRRTSQGWPYNLFAMIHARSMGQVQHVVTGFTEAEGIDSFELLPTAVEFKKQPVKHHFK